MTRPQPDRHPAAGQLADLLTGRVNWLAPLLGFDWLDLDLDLARERSTRRAATLVGQLCSGDDQLSRHTAHDVLYGLFDGDPPDDWWATPLGRLVAAAYGMPGPEHVSYGVAAARLGLVHRSSVAHLVETGRLDRHPGGVTTASVARHLAQRSDQTGERDEEGRRLAREMSRPLRPDRDPTERRSL